MIFDDARFDMRGARAVCGDPRLADGMWSGALNITPASGTEQIDRCTDPSHNVAPMPAAGSFFLVNTGRVQWLMPDSLVMNGATYHRQ